MQYRRLGRTDLEVSSIGMGCVTFGREIDQAASFAVLDRAFEQGITLFDTAEAYSEGGSEIVLGNWLADRRVRDRVVVATKVTAPLTGQRIGRSVDESLRRLQTDRIDLFQLHVWDDAVPLDETLAALDRAIREGKVRYVGCSNWTASQLGKALSLSQQFGYVRLESVQPPYNLVQREIEPDLLPMCLEQQIGVITYSPLGAGFLTGKYSRGGEVPHGTRFDVIPDHQPIYFTRDGFRILERLRQLADERGQSMVQLALSWVLNRPGVTSVLVGGRKPKHVDQAIAAQQTPLAADIRDRLERL